MNLKLLSFAVIAAASFAAPAFAHHSFAMFDPSKTVTLDGTVREFEWTNPHSWIHVVAADASGRQLEWSIEMGSPAQIAQRGFKADIVKPGDKVTVTLHPLKDGSRGGEFLSVKLPNGQTLLGPYRPGPANAQ